MFISSNTFVAVVLECAISSVAIGYIYSLGIFFSHHTSAAIFINNGKVYFGKYPGKSMFAWS